MFSTIDTIAAIATAAGRGAIGVVRISGPEAHAVGRAVLGREAPLRARHATFARLQPGTASTGVGDHVVATFFPAPHSYTTEDTIEISAHGSLVVLASILDACVRHGARIAAPGEFTFRAYIHGRIELTQAEAVADLVDSVTPLQARAAFDQLEGSLATAICGVSDVLLDLTAQLEASLDFPEEGFHFAEPARVRGEVERLRATVQDLLATANEGRAIREGRRVVIAGPPNAGKSSLFNRLAGLDRAIVSATPERRAICSSNRSRSAACRSRWSTRRVCVRRTAMSKQRVSVVRNWPPTPRISPLSCSIGRSRSGTTSASSCGGPNPEAGCSSPTRPICLPHGHLRRWASRWPV